MANTIKHLGIVESIEDHHIQVRIVQTSACASCSIKGHCTSADVKEKLIDIAAADTSSYRQGDHVWVVGSLSMGGMAVLLAFIIPFFIVVVSLFVFMALLGNELYAALGALVLLIPYYYILRLNGRWLGRKFSFSIHPME